jgi:hypothetical protein
MLLNISKGNVKLGKIPSFSLPPLQTCFCDALNTCYKEGCYAKIIYLRWKGVRDAWDKNLYNMNNNRIESFVELYDYFKYYEPEYFRIHVGGDFTDADYFQRWCNLAWSNQSTKFLVFTKKYKMMHLMKDQITENMAVVLSGWTNVPMERGDFSVAWMNDGQETRIPENAILCNGNCKNCMVCWSLSKNKLDVVFKKH